MANQEVSPELKRILVISNRYYPHYKGGYCLSCKLIVDELLKRGYLVQVLTSDWGVSRKQSNGNVHRLLHLGEPSSSHALYRHCENLGWALVSRRDYRTARHLMESQTPDMVYVCNMGMLSLSPLRAARDLGLPFVFDLGDYWLLQRYRELCLEPSRLKRDYRLFIHGLKSFTQLQFAPMLTNSEVLKQQYVESGFSEEQIMVIPRGLPGHYILDTPSPIENDTTVRLLCAGRLTRAKGIHLAIQTVALLNKEMTSEIKRAVHLDIIGEGDSSYMQRLQDLVVSLRLQKRVRFVGRLPQEELINRFKGYHAVLLPSIWIEPFGRIVIEAMAQGACVIASERGGPAELIDHRHNGLLVPPEDPRAMARAVVDLIQDSSLRHHIRHAAIATARERYSIQKVGDQLEAYLSAIVAAHRTQEQIDRDNLVGYC